MTTYLQLFKKHKTKTKKKIFFNIQKPNIPNPYPHRTAHHYNIKNHIYNLHNNKLKIKPKTKTKTHLLAIK